MVERRTYFSSSTDFELDEKLLFFLILMNIQCKIELWGTFDSQIID